MFLPGLITKSQSGFFRVHTESGDFTCQLRGKLKQRRRRLILLLDSHPPVVVQATVSAHDEQAAVTEEWIIFQIPMPNADLKICYRLHNDVGVYFGKALIEGGHL